MDDAQSIAGQARVVAVLADRFRPSAGASALVYDGLLVLAGSGLIALSAVLAVRLPISPVPITGQTFAVLLVGALLGWRRGVATVGLYLLEGACGLPVFAGGVVGGPAYMFGPTGGYLVGFLAGAALTGWLAGRGWDRHFATTAAAMALGSAALFACGVLWLAVLVGLPLAVQTGLLPFLPGEAIKIALAAGLLPTAWKVLRFRGR
jgi:biotin transport system substrate-specific component